MLLKCVVHVSILLMGGLRKETAEATAIVGTATNFFIEARRH